MSEKPVSSATESIIHKLFKTMDLSSAVESDKLAISWLEEHERCFFGFVDGCSFSKEKLEKVVTSGVDQHKICDIFTGKFFCDIFTSDDSNLLTFVANSSTSSFKTWSSLTPRSRSKILNDIAQTLEKYQQLFAVVEAVSSGKNFSRVKAVDVPNLIESFNYYAGCALQLEHSSKTLFPQGPVCVVTEEYSNPILTLSLRVSSVLASGNSVLLLPSVKSSLSSFLLAEICSKSGLPGGVLNVVPIDHGKFKTIGEEPIFSKLIFSGSLQKSRWFSNVAAEAHTPCEFFIPQRPVVIVYESADLHSAVNGVLESFFYHDTQSKSGGCKVLLQESISEEFLSILASFNRKILIGQNMSKTDMSCIVTEDQKKLLNECIEKEKKNEEEEREKEEEKEKEEKEKEEKKKEEKLKETEDGKEEEKEEPKKRRKITELLCTVVDDCRYTRMMPVLISDLQPNSELGCRVEELGGPIIVTAPFRTVKESVAMFNCDDKGSPVSIWTEKISVALEVFLKLKTGTVWVNSENVINTHIPFNGVYSSGNSVEGGKDALFSHLSLSKDAESDIDQVENYEIWKAAEMSSDKLNLLRKESSTSVLGMKENRKEYRLFIGGVFKSADNVELQSDGTILPLATASDVNSAVSSAVAAQPNWESMENSQKRKIFLNIMDKLKKSEKEYVSEIRRISKEDADQFKKEFDEAVYLLHYWAFAVDKLSGPVQEIKKNFLVMQQRKPLGVIGIQCPDEKPLLSFVSMVASAIIHGNTVVAITGEHYPTIALKMCEILSSCGVPRGVVNVISGNVIQLLPALCKNKDINAIWFTEAPHKVIYSHCNPNQKVFYCRDICGDFNEAKSLKCTMESTYVKTVFLPSGVIFAN